MRDAAYIQAIATAVPPTSVTQEAALAFMLRHLALGDAERAFVQRVYSGSGIERRHTVIEDFGRESADVGFFARNQGLNSSPSTSERNTLFRRHANELAAEALGRLFDRAEIRAGEITHLVTASCTGFSAPGFDCHVVTALGMDPTVQRFHLGFMGCFAALPALRLADHICRSAPGARVAVLTVELCTLHFTAGTSRETIVTQSLFSDGAAAALVVADRGVGGSPLYALRSFASRILPGSAGAMTWVIGDHGFEMGLTAAVPGLVGRHMREAVEAQCRAGGIAPSDLRHWAVHPGGRAILDKAAEELGMPHERFGASYGVLRDHGNMSSATLLFVLEALAKDSGSGPVFSAAFGPGLTVESALLERP